MVDPTTLVTKLETRDFSDLTPLYTTFLSPLINQSQPSTSATRSLLKTHLPTISKSLSLLPKLLFETPPHPATSLHHPHLLHSYSLCLDSLDAVTPLLQSKPHGPHLQRARYAHCLLRWDRYEDAVTQGFRVLRGLGGLHLDGWGYGVQHGLLVPKFIGGGEGRGSGEMEGEFARLVVDLVLLVLQCVSLTKSKDADAGRYSRVLVLLEEVRPWFRHVEAGASSKLQWRLLAHMKNATNFLIKEVKHFEGDLVLEFFAATFNEYTQLLNAQSSQGRMGEELEEFVQYLYSCAYKCRSAFLNVRVAVATHLYESAGNFSQDLVYISLIQRLYAMGLYLSNFGDPKGSKGTSGMSLPDGWDKLQDLSSLLVSGKKYYRSESEAYLLFYLNALKFLCGPLAQFVNSERQTIVKEDIESPLGNALKLIQETFLEYFSLFLHCQKDKDDCDEIDMILLRISMAAFTLSLKFDCNTKGSKKLVNFLFSDKCLLSLQPQMLNYIVTMLHNLFVEFYRQKQLKEASKAGKFCCRASWSRCVLLCEIFVGKLKGFDGELPEENIADSVSEACKDNSLLVDILDQIGSYKVDKVMLYGLEKWCRARKLFGKLPYPLALIKRWAKIQCKSHTKSDANAPILSSYLLCSPCLGEHNVTNEIIGIILEQELLAYQEMSNLYPEFCHRMQMEIIDILLQKVHYSNMSIQRPVILARKGMLLRTCGIGGLETCICCLSEAIESINSSYDMTENEATLASHQLAFVYCLRALCTQEAISNSKDILNDVREAVTLWLRTDSLDCVSNNDSIMGCEHVLILLYYISDLLSIKGDTTLYSDVLIVMAKVLKKMNVSLEKCLSLLWGPRRVNHALCVVPVNESLIETLSKHYGKEAESLDFWISSLKDSQPLSVGLQQNFSPLCSFFPLAFHQHKTSLRSDISVDEVNEIASHLISNVSVPGSTSFIAGYLYYDLSERLCSSGRMIEALSCAKEAQLLRSKLLQEHFSYSFKQLDPNHDKIGAAIRKSSDCISQFNVLDQAAAGAWPNSATYVQNSDGFVLTPWNVLRCFLESSLQVGIINEALGNVAEAEAQFIVGKSISCLQSLPPFIIAFSSCLGKLYHGKCLLDLAQKELGTAEQLLAVERNSVTCVTCSLLLENMVNELLGKLQRKGVHCAKGNPYELSLRRLISLKKGDLVVWLEEAKSANTMPGDEVAMKAEIDNRTNVSRPGNKNPIKPERTKVKTEAKKSKKMKKELESSATVVTMPNMRVTRSRKQSSQCDRAVSVGDIPNVTDRHSEPLQKSEATIILERVDCEKCFSAKLKCFDSFTCFIQMKWEFFRRRQILRLLIGLGKCEGPAAGTHWLHKIYSKCISILLGGNDCHCSQSSPLKMDLSGGDIPEDIFAVECAEVFYNLCWFSLQALFSRDTRSVHHDVSCIQLPQVVSLLMRSFVLSRELPLLFQKVSRLLALIYVVSASRDDLSSALSSSKVLSESYWAAYFHQASVGAHHNLHLLAAIGMKRKPCTVSKIKGSQAAMTSMTADICTLVRIAPESTEEIESCVAKFFESLPSTAVVCVSLLGESYVSLLGELVHSKSTVYGWMLLSQLNAENQPFVVLLPLSSVLQDGELSTGCTIIGERNVQKEWRSPWGCDALVDDLAPSLRSILRENYLTCSIFPEEKTEQNYKLWWAQRFNLDRSLQKLLRDMEELWLGQWKYLLLGRWLDAEPLAPDVKELMLDLNDKCKLKVNHSVLEFVMSGLNSTILEKERIPRVFLEKGCFFGTVKDHDKDTCSGVEKTCDGADYIPGSLIVSARKHEEYCTRREPVVLVLDNNVQMLPWENMPIMREQEVYRMPSVASIRVALQRRSILEEADRPAARFPLIDPLDAFYLLNPSGDLSKTQAEFEEWFRLQNMEGKAGVIPSTEELGAALENHDLFLYFGHGSGAQYMPSEKFRKLKNCSATLLMGCSSGSLNLNGCYPPVGTPLCYMLAGAPLVIANLWEVTDGDIDRFAKAVLKSFMDERSMSSTGCIQCRLLAEEFKSMNVNERKGNSKKVRGKKKSANCVPDIANEYCFRHKLRAGYFVSQARKACKLPFLIGAAPVCYGVPTGIRKKEDI